MKTKPSPEISERFIHRKLIEPIKEKSISISHYYSFDEDTGYFRFNFYQTIVKRNYPNILVFSDLLIHIEDVYKFDYSEHIERILKKLTKK